MAVKLSDTMLNELRYAAQEGYQGEVVYAGRKTVDALLRRGLITVDYDNAKFGSSKLGYRNPVLTVAGWAVIGERPADPDRLSFEDAWEAAHSAAAPACICPVRTDYHSLDCMTFRAAHSATDTEESDNVTIKEGPLTERQVAIIEGLLVGKRHEEISRNLSTPDETVTVSVVKQECQNITAKFKAKTITQAVFVYSEAQAYRKAAAEILRGLIPVPIDETEVHTNHVLEDLAKLYQGRHDAWMPA